MHVGPGNSPFNPVARCKGMFALEYGQATAISNLHTRHNACTFVFEFIYPNFITRLRFCIRVWLVGARKSKGRPM